MFCSRCGTVNEDGVRFCTHCGESLNFVPKQNVPHNFRPYSQENRDALGRSSIKPMGDPFADELPEEKPVKPLANPFDEFVPLQDGYQDVDEIVDQSWAIRIVMACLIVAMIVIILVNVNDRTTGIDVIKFLYDDIGGNKFGRSGSDTAYLVCKMIFYHGTILFGVIRFVSALRKHYGRPFLTILLFLSSLSGVIGDAILQANSRGYGTANFVPGVIATVISVTLLILNGRLSPKESYNDEIYFAEEGPSQKENPLL